MSRPREFLLWAAETFGWIALERRERVTRFLEEAIEVGHAEGVPTELLGKLIERIYAKPPEPFGLPKEIGQAQACLETFAESIGISADEEATREFSRVKSIPKSEWTRRHQAKIDRGIAS